MRCGRRSRRREFTRWKGCLASFAARVSESIAMNASRPFEPEEGMEPGEGAKTSMLLGSRGPWAEHGRAFQGLKLPHWL